ncbi:hypothetical protein NQ318_000224 [Aromia moschata]|uniref:Uncharacterized protein n=1 Tax=Aromia moschata TaxID=1265417 RepID=A0AAV8Y1K7_9CUCU|nr:hypothetical protein NQ318_000224 [Aromia moschata]
MYVRIRESLFQLCRNNASDREGRRNLTEKGRGDIPAGTGPAHPVTLPRRSVYIFFCNCIGILDQLLVRTAGSLNSCYNGNTSTISIVRTLILISRQTKITTCKFLECKRTAETFGHQNT